MSTIMWHDDEGEYCNRCGQAKADELIDAGKLLPPDEVDDPDEDPIVCHTMDETEEPFECAECGALVTPK